MGQTVHLKHLPTFFFAVRVIFAGILIVFD